jgi:uncharacterized membrane protein YfcA
VHIDPYVTLAGLIVGLIVGMTGMGGGALMTPILVLLFKVQPLAAVSSDLVASMVMKPVGGAVHLRRRTVRTDLVRWLMAGSIPSAFGGVLIVRLLGRGVQLQERVKVALGIALVVAAAAIILKGYLQTRRLQRPGSTPGSRSFSSGVRKLPTLLVGVAGGLVVGLTSVGSGSLIIVMLMFLYPALTGSELVGTDLVQAVPLVTAAAVGHLLFGDFHLGLTASILLGSIPGVYIGAKLSSRAPDAVVRPALIVVLLASGLRLLNVSSIAFVLVFLAVAALGPPIWGILDAVGWRDEYWVRAGQNKRRWIAIQAVGTFVVGLGSGAAIAYFVTARPRLAAAAVAEVSKV